MNKKEKKHAIYQDKFILRVSEMTNVELLEETLDSMSGDDCDGCFTAHGQWECNYLQNQLRRRLVAAGWLAAPASEAETMRQSAQQPDAQA